MYFQFKIYKKYRISALFTIHHVSYTQAHTSSYWDFPIDDADVTWWKNRKTKAKPHLRGVKKFYLSFDSINALGKCV